MSRSFTQSFYHFDYNVNESKDQIAEETPMTATENVDTAIELQSSQLPVFSTYVDAVMPNDLPADYFLRPAELPVKNIEQQLELPPIVENEEPIKEYKESVYMGFQADVKPAYNSVASRSARVVTFAEPVVITASRLVKPIVIESPPSPNPSDMYSTVEGDAFKPVAPIAPMSEYQFPSLNELYSFGY